MFTNNPSPPPRRDEPARARRAVRRSRVTRARGDYVASDGVTLHRWEGMPKTELRPDLHRRFIATERVMLAQLYLEPGSVVPYHEHENEQLTYILEGTLRFWLGEDQSEVIDVHAGEVLHTPSWLPHKAEALERTVDVDIFTPPRQDWIDGTDRYFQRTRDAVKALVKSRAEPGVWLEDVPEPEIGINDVLIRVGTTGICGT